MGISNWIKEIFLKEVVKPLPDDKPSAKMVFIDGKIAVESYNSAFIDDLKTKLGDLTVGKTDDEIIATFMSREELTLEEPRLDVNHSGITEDGRVMMKLDWNASFIKHLKQNGITGDTEEDAVNKYLALITKKVASEDTDLFNTMEPHAAMAEMDEMLAAELDVAAKQVEDAQRETRQAKRRMKKQNLKS